MSYASRIGEWVISSNQVKPDESFIDPIKDGYVFNKVDYPELANLKPSWVHGEKIYIPQVNNRYFRQVSKDEELDELQTDQIQRLRFFINLDGTSIFNNTAAYGQTTIKEAADNYYNAFSNGQSYGMFWQNDAANSGVDANLSSSGWNASSLNLTAPYKQSNNRSYKANYIINNPIYTGESNNYANKERQIMSLYNAANQFANTAAVPHYLEYSVLDSADLIRSGKETRPKSVCVKYYLKAKDPLKELFGKIYPVGSIYISMMEINPSDLFGGTWEKLSPGKFLVNVDPNDTEIDEANKEGGTNRKQLTIEEMPKHSHEFEHIQMQFPKDKPIADKIAGYEVEHYSFKKINTKEEGGSKPFDIRPSFVSCFMYRRTAL